MMTQLKGYRGNTVIVNHFFEPVTGGHIIKLSGQDSAGNKLDQEVEFLIVTQDRTSAVLNSVEALTALLRNVDDFKIIDRNEISMGEWQPEQMTNGEINGSET